MSIDVLLSDIDSFIKAPNGIKELRSILMQLAIMGKLIKQNISDGNASNLIRRINKKREELIKLKEFKKSPKYEKAEIDAVPFDVPENWVWSTLSRLGQINPKNTIEDDDIDSSFLPMATISEKYSEKPSPEIRKWSEIKKGFTHVSDQDVAVAKITPCFENGKACVLEGLISGVGAGTTELHVFRPVPNTVLPKYIYLFLKSPEFNLKGRDHMTGTAGQKRVSAEFFATTPVPVPPLEEQKRIVKKVDELMALCDQLEVQQQQQANTLLKASTAAIQALLSPDNSKDDLKNNWQRLADNFHTLYGNTLPMPPGEGRQKKHLVALDNVKLLRQAILALAVEGKLTKGGSSSINHFKISDIFELIDGDRGPNYPKKHDYMEEGYCLFLSTKNVRKDGFLFDECVFIDEVKHNTLRKGTLSRGDLVITTRGTLGNIAVYEDSVPYDVVRVNSGMLILRPKVDDLDPKYFSYFIQSPAFGMQLEEMRTGSAQQQIPVKILKEFKLPKPSINEQKNIVKKIDELIAICDKLELQLTAAYADAEKLITATTKALVA